MDVEMAWVHSCVHSQSMRTFGLRTARIDETIYFPLRSLVPLTHDALFRIKGSV
jgi:hypothetical protein